MNDAFLDDPLNAPNQNMPSAIPSLIAAAVAAFDADRDTSRRYLLRASAFLRVELATRAGCEGARRSDSRGGLLAWQVKRVVDYIETHLAEKITAARLADLIKVSTGQLFRAFKISVGVTPFKFLAWRRVELACSMMMTKQAPLAQIAVACGLCDQAHLCKVFRRLTGMSPSAWCRAMRALDPDGGRLAQSGPDRTQRHCESEPPIWLPHRNLPPQ
jgi:AraC family transcriptional regulator